ncbi:MAG: hypothetical protein NVS2B4_22640 [Ramlibacter sp.]
MSATAVDAGVEAQVAELTVAAHGERDARICCRMLAVRHVLAGHGAAETVGVFAVGRTQLYAWLGRYRAEGIGGLADRPRPGAAPHLASEREAAFLARLHAVSPPDSGLSEWRGEDLASAFGPGVRRPLLALGRVRSAAPGEAVEPGAAPPPSGC